jgi:hypothetical protein
MDDQWTDFRREQLLSAIWAIDNVQLSTPSAVPIPAALPLLGSTIGLGWLIGRKNRVKKLLG